MATSNWRKISDAPRGIGPLLLRSLLAAAAFALTASIVPANAQSPQPVYGNFSAGSNYVAVSGGTIGVPCCSVSPTIQFVPLLGVNQGGHRPPEPAAEFFACWAGRWFDGADAGDLARIRWGAHRSRPWENPSL